eukprot:CAMPEP_0176443248 /NCGR_PEP_ID=MMETSP0127-20121128/22311_1 /TAXON_ID=938130 /ORGANISM="Platyophrya macrostoma, Strain WH" /LENGTH=466 /DNA_ID=CAMNT_0017828443 /DNA_START=70 /DNA_END=1470 /DNA_ORIENTATION=+
MTTPTEHSEKRAPLKLPNNQEVISKLVHEFEDIFTKEKLGNYPQLVFKMNESLEIPITALYKEKRVSTITTNLVLIREALKNTSQVIYDPKRETVKPDFKPLKNILIVNHLDDSEKERFLSVLSESPEYSRKISENFFDAMGGYSLVLQTEADAEKLCSMLKEKQFGSRQLEIFVEQENLYLTILQKAQDAMKFSYQTYGYGYGQMDPSFYYQNYYYFANMYPGYYQQGYGYGKQGGKGGYEFDEYAYPGKSQGKKGRGSANYSQKDGYDDAEEEEGQAHGDDYHSKGHGRGKNQKKKGQGASGQRNYREYEKKSSHKEHETMSPAKQEEIIKRTRINSENFPSLEKAEKAAEKESPSTTTAKPEKKGSGLKHGDTIIGLSKNEIVASFEKYQKAGVIKIAPSLAAQNEDLVPVLEKKGEPSLEVIQPKVIIRETKPRRRSTWQENDEIQIQRSPAQGGADLTKAT